MPTAQAIDALPEALRQPVRQFADLLRSLAGDNAQSLTLYGAIAAGAFDASRHSVRSVLVVETVDLHMLRRLADHGVKLGKANIAAPLIMTPKYIAESLDTFPLELIEIHQYHLTLFGSDPFDELTLADENVRLQCERELKVMALGLRQGLLAAAGREKVFVELQVGMGENLMRVLRGMLWLKDRPEAQPAGAVISEAENLIKRKLPGVRAAVAGDAPHGWDQFEALYHDIQALLETVDAW